MGLLLPATVAPVPSTKCDCSVSWLLSSFPWLNFLFLIAVVNLYLPRDKKEEKSLGTKRSEGLITKERHIILVGMSLLYKVC